MIVVVLAIVSWSPTSGSMDAAILPPSRSAILIRVQNSLDRGCYTEAIGYYRRVLDDDSRNGSATGGLEKARVRMRLSGANAQCSR